MPLSLGSEECVIGQKSESQKAHQRGKPTTGLFPGEKAAQPHVLLSGEDDPTFRVVLRQYFKEQENYHSN